MLRPRRLLRRTPRCFLGRRPLAGAGVLGLRELLLALHLCEGRPLGGGGRLGGPKQLQFGVRLGAGGLLGAAPVLFGSPPRRSLVLAPAARTCVGLRTHGAMARALRLLGTKT